MPEVTNQFVRIPVQPQSAFQDGSIRSMVMNANQGIRALIGKVKGKTTTAVMTYIFEITKGWTMDKAKKWVAEHKSRHLTHGWSSQVERYPGDKDLRVILAGETIRLEEPSEEEKLFNYAKIVELKDNEITVPLDHVELDKDGIPIAFRIAEFGDLPNSKYPDLKVTELTAKGTMAWFAYKGMPEFPMDWSHKSSDGTDESSPGWWKPEVRQDGIWASGVRWTPRAYEQLKNKEIKHFSLEAKRNGDTGELLAITCIALTNRPAANNQLPLVLSDAAKNGAKSPTTPSEKEDVIMKSFYERLGLPETATEEEVLAALDALEGKVPEATETAHAEALTAKDTEIAALKEKVDPVLTDFRLKTLETCKLTEKDGFEKVLAYIKTLEAQEPDKVKLADLEAKVEAQEKILEQNRIDKLVEQVESKATPDNRASIRLMATTLSEDDFLATMKGWPEIKADPKKPIEDAKLKERNKDIMMAECLTDGDRAFFAEMGWDPKSEDGKKKIEAHIATKLGQ
jgi:hypothetical protein